MKFDAWWQIEGAHLGANNYELAQAAFEAGQRDPEFKLKACQETLREMKTLCDNTPLNECKTEVIFKDVRKQNETMDKIHDLILQLLDTCRNPSFSDRIS